MIIFVDESGDPGLKLDRGSSRYLIIALVVFYTGEETQRVANRIRTFRKSVNYPSTYEFKFNKSKKSIKLDFLRSVADCEFEVFSVVLDKTILDFTLRKKVGGDLYDICFKYLLENSIKGDVDVKVRLDGLSGREFKRSVTVSLRKYLRKNLKGEINLDFKFVNSKNDVIVQLADMIVGSIRRSYSRGKGDSLLYKDIIKEKIVSEEVLEKSDLVSILKQIQTRAP